jgi:hypothetical protein
MYDEYYYYTFDGFVYEYTIKLSDDNTLCPDYFYSITKIE